VRVSFRTPLRVVLMLLPLVTTATTIHAHKLAPDIATQEMNRCLRLVRIAASRRKSRRTESEAGPVRIVKVSRRPARLRTARRMAASRPTPAACATRS
jgi:hypothetical protein